MGHVTATALRLARTSDGLVRRGELTARGIARSTIRRRIAAGEWREPLPGVVDATGAPWTWERRVVAAVLYGPPGTTASHRTAAALHGVLGVPRRGSIEITVRRAARSRDVPFRVHSTVHPSTPVAVDGIPTTPLARTALDLATVVDDRVLARAVRLALVEGGLIGWLDGNPWWERAPSAGRFRRAVEAEASHAARRTESPLEERALELLREDHRLREVETQVAVVASGRRMRFDLAWPDARVALELDGAAAHGDHLAAADDRARDAAAEGAGWVVLRATAADLATAPSRAALTARLVRTLSAQRSTGATTVDAVSSPARQRNAR